MLASVWVNDTEVAAWLKATYSFDVYYAPIERTMDDSMGVVEEVWSWGLEGQPASSVRTVQDLLPTRGSSFDWRMFWFNESGVSYLDLHEEFTAPFSDPVYQEEASRLSHGTLEAPMIPAGQNYVATGEQRHEAMTGRITKFADHFCTKEIL